MDTLYLVLFLLIILSGTIAGYVYYLKEKKAQLDTIRRGFCPSCKQNTIEITDQRSAGCCGPKVITFECTSCSYTNSFSIEQHSCGR